MLEEVLRCPPGLYCGSGPWFMTASMVACEYFFCGTFTSGCFCCAAGLASADPDGCACACGATLG